MQAGSVTNAIKSNFSVSTALKIGAVIGAVVVFLPQEKMDWVQDKWAALRNSPEHACLEYIRPRLKDPQSGRLVSGKLTTGKPQVVEITYRATNSYGASVTEDTKCYISNGQVNPEMTAVILNDDVMQNELDRLLLKKECIARRNVLVDKGMKPAEASAKIQCD